MAKLNLEKLRKHIQGFEFQALFNELGWDNAKLKKSIVVNENDYSLTAIAEKRGFIVFTCQSDKFPSQAERKKIAYQIGTIYHEHLIIYFNTEKQIWQISVKELNKPIQYKETEYYSHQEPKLLLSRLRGIFFTLDEEDNIYLVDVTNRVNNNFNANTEKTTKKFYDQFKKQHTAFIKYIKGLDGQANKEWYASLMLNRLMFIYFIQKKGFLNNDEHYLRTKLNQVCEAHGENKFYSFYRHFLLAFFHEGLGKEHKDNKELIALIGNVPYLNGGLFDVHELEINKDAINIADDAFVQLFDFFDQYQWHLDTNANATGKEINPDVIGYIFEKYINDRAAMGAYYTKEDITEYIGKNTIIPFLFDKVKTECANAFKTNSSLWQLLKDSPDRYIYDAVKKGCEYTDIPENIAIGIDNTALDLLTRRNYWNTPTPEKFALPTEIWRETIARRQRYTELNAKLINGEITDINDLITLNLNIRQFAQDALDYYEGSDFIEAFYNAIENITVLDPTCGSGAFLFAALNILEPLYEACIKRMREFVENAPDNKFKKFRDILTDIDKHANPTYWIYKKIILNNLYGVDIMQEAVEVAKLRLFLKLAAMSEADYKKPNLGLEPLPDIDFNIRCGNTLIGYTTHEQIRKAVELDINGQVKLFVDDSMVLIDVMIQDLQGVLRRYKANQLIDNVVGLHEDKQEIIDRLAEIKEQLDWFLARDYGIDSDNKKKLAQWKASHQPFHWFTEFFRIINKGGFDVIIGNPPYVEYSKVKKDYLIKGYETESCGNLYAFVMERIYKLLKENSKSGMIIPHSSICTDRMSMVQKQLTGFSNLLWVSSYDIRPAKLFNGVDQRLAIYIFNHSTAKNNMTFSSSYHRWNEEFRSYLFSSIDYVNITKINFANSLPKFATTTECKLWDKVKLFSILNIFISKTKKTPVYFHNAPRYWIRGMDFVPYFWNEKEGEKISVQVKPIYLTTQKKILVAMLNSSLFYWWFVVLSDCRHLNLREIDNFPVGFEQLPDEVKSKLGLLTDSLMIDFQKNAQRKECFYKMTGNVVYDEFDVKKSKPIIDEIDKVLAQHYGFTDEELDFIINYDIKYRMGKELD
jgi:hypothetical protein